ncbi:reverse transcriptase family protein, partial [Pseudomonas aeruginosa]
WGISVKVLKSVIDIIASHLVSIFNDCIKCGVFPDLMKHSKVIPLFKSGSTDDPSNYRPISVLPTLSKIFEKIILTQLLEHFNSNNLLHNKQFGFTRGRSTTDAGAYLVKNIFKSWEESHDCLGIFCDLSKAFDCVEHETLVRKLHHYGIRDGALELITSYLSGRIQTVDVKGNRSSGTLLKMGVPQGSILGPFLFLIYINDLPSFIESRHEVVLFADDTSLLFKIKRQLQVYDEVNDAISCVVHWFRINNLLLNSKKTKCIKFTLKCIKPSLNVRQVDSDVIVSEESLELVESTVFLGITVDSKLQWGPHIHKLASKLSSAAYAVKKIRMLTNADTARLVYFSYFHSVMSYGILLWGNAADVETIFILQKRAIRAIYNMHPRESLRDKFKEIKILTLASQYIFENLLYVRKNIVEFPRVCDLHNVNTRNKHRLALPAARIKKISNSFRGLGVQLFN